MPFERITLLVNVWLNHHPGGIVRFPSDTAATIGSVPTVWGDFRKDRCTVLKMRHVDRTRWHPPLTRDLTVGGAMQLKISFPDPGNLWSEDETSLLRLDVPNGDGVVSNDASSNPPMKRLEHHDSD